MIRRRARRLSVRVLGACLLGALLAGIACSPALAAGEPAAWLRLASRSIPTNLAPGHEGTIFVTATDLGNAEVPGSAGQPVTIIDKLPPGLTVTGTAFQCEEAACPRKQPKHATNGVVEEHSSCTFSSSLVTCKFEEGMSPFERFEVRINVAVSGEIPSGTEVQNEVSIEGAGVPATPSLQRALKVSSDPVPFGIERYELAPESESGEPQAQAGSHPFQLTTNLVLNAGYHEYPNGVTLPLAPEPLRRAQVALPSGFVGNANKNIIAQCAELQFTTVLSNNLANQCPGNTAVGVAIVNLTEPILHTTITADEPVYNLVPAKGEPARFGFLAFGVPVTLDTVVREGDYHIVVNAGNVSESPGLLQTSVTIWGVPGDERHDNSRGSQCVAHGSDALPGEECSPPSPRVTSPFLTMPTSCTGPLQSAVAAQSWRFGAAPLNPVPALETESLSGCELLPFSPTMSVKPHEQRSNTPTGLDVLLTVPQATTLEETGLAEADIRDTTVALPEGVQLSPSAANGLESCSVAQIGYENKHSPVGTIEFNGQPASCPDASKVGQVRIKSPVLERELTGSVYLAAQSENPFGSLFGIYIVVEDEVTGVRVKLAGEVKLDPTTGRITSVFPNAPQLPFEELELTLFNGPRASIATPRACGTYTTQASFTPWSGTPAVESLLNPEEFNITSGPGGSPCANPQPFNPSFQAGAVNSQAAAFTPFTVSIGRADTDQALKSISMTLPPGLSGLLSAVELCGEPQAEQGTCGEASLIGHATAVAGLGEQPFTVTGGRVYITGPYHGAPFGLSIVIPAKAGPFDFGFVVTRSTINVNPSTAQISIGSDLPTMLNSTTYHTGVPVQLRRVDVTVERPNGAPFQFNPTNCSPLSITGTLGGDQGGSAPASSRFQVSGCDKLPFAPQLTASTGGTASKSNGASLNVKVVSHGLGQANIAKVRLQLPLALPSRLTTIQKACLLAVFNANPATCPEGSQIGHATIHTPVLKNPLSGPAYLVSHGGEAFPDVEFVLQGEGVTILLDGKTDIKKGITYSRFEAAPDAPFTTFETVLPTGPHSALTAYVPKTPYNLCTSKLVMPTEIVAQNGNIIKQNTKIGVSGCKPKILTKKQLLAKALKACKKKKNKHKRQACERAAHKKYQSKKSTKSKKK
jgi:hypothetical protein